MAEPTPDQRLVTAWAEGQQSPRTRTAYAYEGRRLLARLGKPLLEMDVIDLQQFIVGLGEGLAPATIGLAVSAMKSLWAFGLQTGVLSADPTKTLQPPPIKNVLAERILDEADVRRMIDDEPDRPQQSAAGAVLWRRHSTGGTVWARLARCCRSRARPRSSDRVRQRREDARRDALRAGMGAIAGDPR